MTCVDSSVWIDYFNGIESWQTDYLDILLDKEPIIIGDLILTEVLQGFRYEKSYHYAKTLLTDLPYMNMLSKTLAIQSAVHYRLLRQHGVTVRKTIDVIIATFCINYHFPLLHSDNDFNFIENHLDLKVIHE